MVSMDKIHDDLVIIIMSFLNLKSLGSFSRTATRYRKLKAYFETKLQINLLGETHAHYQWKNECFSFKQIGRRSKNLYHYYTDGPMFEYTLSKLSYAYHEIILFVYRIKNPYIAIYDNKGYLIKSDDERAKQRLPKSVINFFSQKTLIIPDVYCLL